MMRIKTIIAAAAIAVTSTAVSADMKPAVIYDMGGKFCLLYTSDAADE